MPIVSIVSRENEDLGVERLNGGGGVAYLSLTETSDGMLVRGILTKEFADHRAALESTEFELGTSRPGVPASWHDAQRRWAEWLDQTRTGWKDLER